MPIFGGRSNYPYLCARVKSKKSFLLSKDAFHRLLSMDIPEIGRYLGETQYREEVADLSVDYAGTMLIELAVSQNLAKTYSDILSFSGGHAREMIVEYLHRWDIYNIKTAIRGRLTNASPDEIREILIHAGSLGSDYMNQLIQSSTIDEFIDRIKQQSVVYIEEEVLREAASTGKLAPLEDALDKEYYSSLLKSIKQTTISEKRLSEFVRREVDIVNLKTLFKLKSEGISGEALAKYFIPGGMEFKIERLTRISASEGMQALTDELRQSSYAEYIQEDIDALMEGKDVSPALRALDKGLLGTADKFSHLYPLSVLPVIDYMLRKKTEVENIRIIIRGKESGLSTDLINRLLVL